MRNRSTIEPLDLRADYRPRLLGLPRGAPGRLSARSLDAAARTLWTFETEASPGTLTLVPDLLVHVVFDLGGSLATEPLVVVADVSPRVLQIPAESLVVGIGFELWRAYGWLGGADEFAWLSKVHSWADMVYLMLLQARARGQDPIASADRYLGWFEEELRELSPEDSGLFGAPLPPSEMAARAGYSPRQFQRLQRKATGLAPRQAARVARFQRLLGHLQDSGVLDLSGFSDQAHATREFRAFTGLTPAAYLRDYDFVRNLQDPDAGRRPPSRA